MHTQAQFEQAAVDLGPSMLLLPYSNVASPVHEPSPGRGPAAASTAQHQRGHLRHTTTETPPGGGSAGATEVQHQREDLRHTTTETPLGRGSAGQLLHAWEVLGDIYYPPIWVARPELADAWLRAARAAMVAGLADVGEICKHVAFGHLWNGCKRQRCPGSATQARCRGSGGDRMICLPVLYATKVSQQCD
eukprot:scaffold85644_cov17-Tisochrysis_lutea.AAC.2